MVEVKSTNITWHSGTIDREVREKINGHKSAIIWLTGLSSSGKSTIGCKLEEELCGMKIKTYVLDGDNIRHGLNKDLGFSPEDRNENIRRIGEVAKLFMDAGTIVMTSFISPYRNDRDCVRSIVPEGKFIEIFVKCSVEECEKRDPKGLYKKARAGEIPEFTGITAPYEEPLNPEIVIDTEQLSVDESVDKIIDYLKVNGYIS